MIIENNFNKLSEELANLQLKLAIEVKLLEKQKILWEIRVIKRKLSTIQKTKVDQQQ